MVRITSLSNHVAKVYADAESDPPLLGHLGLAPGHPTLDLDSTADGIHHAGKLRQEAVARVLDDPAAVFLDLRID